MKPVHANTFTHVIGRKTLERGLVIGSIRETPVWIISMTKEIM